MEEKEITIKASMNESQAEAFAQFLKRALFETYRGRAKNEAEAYEMIAAGEILRKSFAEAGFAPR